jgi:hypothetical protein
MVERIDCDDCSLERTKPFNCSRVCLREHMIDYDGE